MEIGSIQGRIDAISRAFAEKPPVINKTSKEEVQSRVDTISEFTGLKDNIKTEAKSITDINVIFGGLKKSEKTLIKIDKALDELDGNNKTQIALKINDLVMNTTYKDKQLLSAIPLKSGDFNSIEIIAKHMGLDDVDNFKNSLNNIATKIGSDLTLVKGEIMAKTNILGNVAQTSVDNSGISMDLGSITKTTNMSYLKQQVNSLLE